MSRPLINILIRNKYRPELLRRCLQSVYDQNYSNVRLIIASDTAVGYIDAQAALKEIEFDNCKIIRLNPEVREKHYWNLYCNDLKEWVHSGWFFYLDNDDYLHPGSLKELSRHLTATTSGIICQFIRNGKPKPNDKLIRTRMIIRGRIGGGSIVLRHDHKDLANWDGEAAADYRFIKAISQKVALKFIPMILQVAGNKGLHGQ